MNDTPTPIIIQLLMSPNNSVWQGVLLGLGDDGITYHCQGDTWQPYIPPLALQDKASELTAVTEQRDRLADLVRQFIYILDITEESDGGRLFHPTNITSCRAGDLQKAGELVEALRRASRNQPTEP